MPSWAGFRSQRSEVTGSPLPLLPSPDAMLCSWSSTPPAGESWRYGRCSRGRELELLLWANTAGIKLFITNKKNTYASAFDRSQKHWLWTLKERQTVCALLGWFMLATVWWGWTVWPVRAGNSTPSKCVYWTPSQEHWGQSTSPFTWPSGWRPDRETHTYIKQSDSFPERKTHHTLSVQYVRGHSQQPVSLF